MKGLDKYDLLSDLAKRRGFFWPSFEIYGGVSGYMDLGPLGSRLKRRIEDLWLALFVQQHRFVTISTPVITPEQVFAASGHLQNFKDLMVTCNNCHRHFKADLAISEAMPGRTDIAVEAMSPNEIDALVKDNNIRCPECGGPLGQAELFSTMFKTNIGPYGDVTGYGRPEAAQAIFTDFKRVYDASRERLPLGIAQVGTVMRNEISPRQGPIRLREFTIMEMEIFFDPAEPKCPHIARLKEVELPLLLAEVREKGKSDVVRVTITEAVERGYVKTEWSAYFMAVSLVFAKTLGIPYEKQRFEEKLPAERAHYSAQTFDHQILLDRWGWVEIAGHAYRTDFDLNAHIKGSKVDLSIFKPYATPVEKKSTVLVPLDSVIGPLLRQQTQMVSEAIKGYNPEDAKAAFASRGFFEVHGFKVYPTHVKFEDRNLRESGRRVVPHVVEPSYGAERLVYSTLEYAYTRVDDRVVLKLPATLAPVQIMVFPLMPKDGLDVTALTIVDDLISHQFDVEYDESGTIGRRYARADEIGVPISVTVDYGTIKDHSVTLRDRDTRSQVRTNWELIANLAHEFLMGKMQFSQLGQPVVAKADE
ncbi:MAG: glycine--tRNA ligase [Candidatus Bathyarchaeia archaeon]